MSQQSKATEPPVLSVVIAAMSGCHYLENCLAALAAQRSKQGVEVIVVQERGDSEGMDQAHQVAALVRRHYPWARLVQRTGPATLAQLRAAGIGCATGEIVAITEDHCIPAADWCATLVNVHATQPALAIGGAVDNAATQRSIDWAVYWCEYSAFASPVVPGPVAGLPGANVSYKRTALPLLGEVLADGYREGAIHACLAAAGVTSWLEPSLRVWHQKHFTLRSYCHERFHYSRWYAGTRRRQLSRGSGLLYLCATPLLPGLLLLRLGRRTRRHPDDARRFAAALPYLLLFVCVWSLGEAAGLIWGPGASEYELR